MNLRSCDNCGVVVDIDKVPFPDDIYAPDDTIDDTKAIWIDREFVPYIRCPVCNNEIPDTFVK
jgi:hypothetical protein